MEQKKTQTGIYGSDDVTVTNKKRKSYTVLTYMIKQYGYDFNWNVWGYEVIKYTMKNQIVNHAHLSNWNERLINAFSNSCNSSMIGLRKTAQLFFSAIFDHLQQGWWLA